jgi:transcription initiation factor IIE alpha subunit
MRKSMIAALVGVLALGGAAVAFANDSSTNTDDGREAAGAFSIAGGPLVTFGEGHDRSFAKDLAAELNLSTDEVEQALEAVAEKRLADDRQQMAENLSEHLDGVSVDDIDAALGVAEEQMREAFEDGDPPAPGQFTETLAKELGLSEDEVEDALAALGEDAFSAHREDAEKRLDEAVEAGKLSEEEADAIRERFENLPPPPALGRGDEDRVLPLEPPHGRPGVSFAFPPV